MKKIAIVLVFLSSPGTNALAQSPPFNATSVSTLGGNCAVQGGFMYQSSGGLSKCASPTGNSGKVWTSNGPGVDPTWTAPGALSTNIQAGSTPTTSYSANQFVYSDGSKAQAATIGADLSFAGGTLSVSSTPTFSIATLNGTISGSATAGALAYGTLGYSDTNMFASFQTSVNSYAQMILQNTSNGATASTDLVLSNNLGTATTYYANLGINSSGFTGSGSFNLPNATYLSATSGDLTIGTLTGNAIHFVVNNGASDAAGISSSGAFSAVTMSLGGAALGTNTLAVTGGISSSSGVTASGTSVFNLVAMGGTAVSSSSLYVDTNNMTLWSGGLMRWSASLQSASTADTFIGRAGAATIELGAADAAAPVAQTLRTQGVVAGTANTNGANFNIGASPGTGTGTGGSLVFQVAPAGSSGSTQNALVAALTIDSTKTATFAGSITTSGTVNSGTVNSGIYGTTGGTGVYFSSTLDERSSAIPVSWSSTSTANGTADTGLSRISANVIGVGNGTAGDYSGALKLTQIDVGAVATVTATTTQLMLGGASISDVYAGSTGSYKNFHLDKIGFNIYSSAALPSCSGANVNLALLVNDALSPVMGNVVVSGGSTYTLVVCQSSAWHVL